MTQQWTTQRLFDALKDVTLGGNVCLYTQELCESFVPVINRIQALKKEKNAIILAHSYISPEILRTVADYTGDSFELSKKAKNTNASTIVFAAVKFMAETAKLLNPSKTVIVPSKNNGCSLADSITGDDVRTLRKAYPNYTFVCYINTSVAVKAACDVCVTSSNVYKIIEAIPNDNIYFLPDRLMAQNIINYLKVNRIQKNLRYTDGTCYVHEEYDPDMIEYVRQTHEGVKVVSHPECNEAVIQKSDFVGSTSQMMDYVEKSKASSYFMITECGLTSRLQLALPNKTFVGTCNMCKYMKANSLADIEAALQAPREDQVISISDDIATKARHCMDEMFRYVK